MRRCGRSEPRGIHEQFSGEEIHCWGSGTDGKEKLPSKGLIKTPGHGWPSPNASSVLRVFYKSSYIQPAIRMWSSRRRCKQSWPSKVTSSASVADGPRGSSRTFASPLCRSDSSASEDGPRVGRVASNRNRLRLQLIADLPVPISGRCDDERAAGARTREQRAEQLLE